MKRSKKWGRIDLMLLVVVSFLVGVLTTLSGLLSFFFFQQEGEHPFRMEMEQWAPLNGERSKQLIEKQKRTSSSDERSYFSPNHQQKVEDIRHGERMKYRLWETTTVIRNALYQYIKQNGQMPSKLSALTTPYPQNYLSSIPKNPVNHSNFVSKTRVADTGWLYQPQLIHTGEPNEIKKAVKQAVTPLLKTERHIPFEPLKLIIIKSENRLYLVSGSKVMAEYPVALGVDHKTPNGTFDIQKRLVNPNKSYYSPETNPYGTRSLELSDPSYAIHGTNRPDKVGTNVSNGCIRLKNEDIETIYPKVSLHTPLEISDKRIEPLLKERGAFNQNRAHLTNDLYDHMAQPKEEDPLTYYRWLD